MCLYKTAGVNPCKQIALKMNEMHLTYQDMRSLTQLLVLRRVAFTRATPEQFMCCEVLWVLDKDATKERDAELTPALRQICEAAWHMFTHRPDDAEEIYEKIRADIQEQVATRATQVALIKERRGRRLHQSRRPVKFPCLSEDWIREASDRAACCDVIPIRRKKTHRSS